MEWSPILCAAAAFAACMFGLFCWFQGLTSLRRRKSEPRPGPLDVAAAALIITAGKWAVLGANVLLSRRPENFHAVIMFFGAQILLLPEVQLARLSRAFVPLPLSSDAFMALSAPLGALVVILVFRKTSNSAS